jgi:hypothetical protein
MSLSNEMRADVITRASNLTQKKGSQGSPPRSSLGIDMVRKRNQLFQAHLRKLNEEITRE